MPDPDRSALASTSVAAHLTRGAIGFGLIGSAVALTPSHGPVALLLAPPGIVALRGCPTCWIAGLIQTISAGRLQRTCIDNSCTLHQPTPTTTPRRHDHPGTSRRPVRCTLTEAA
jgi:hypothetical protein